MSWNAVLKLIKEDGTETTGLILTWDLEDLGSNFPTNNDGNAYYETLTILESVEQD
jgi:hypothetical protein